MCLLSMKVIVKYDYFRENLISHSMIHKQNKRLITEKNNMADIHYQSLIYFNKLVMYCNPCIYEKCGTDWERFEIFCKN